MSSPRKICSLAQLLELRARAVDAGKTVVHCHGSFDIVHPGHIHHLQHARSLGDLLIVSVSSDQQINKGIDRPLIPEDLRATRLAALECVDLVYVSEHPTAVELLEQLRPDIYDKGREYETNDDPRFLAERQTVTKHGGRVVFSSGEVVYSSTALIGQMQRTQQFRDEKIHRFCRRLDLSTANLRALLQCFRNQKVLDTKEFDGGAAVVSRHLPGLVASPTLVTALSDDDTSRQAELRLRAAGATVHAVRNRKQVVTKNRYLVDESKLFKVDDRATAPLDSRDEQHLADTILDAAQGVSAGALVADGRSAGMWRCIACNSERHPRNRRLATGRCLPRVARGGGRGRIRRKCAGDHRSAARNARRD